MATFETHTHKDRARFTVPKTVRVELGLRDTGGDSVELKIDSPTGHYEGIKTLKSGAEIYGKDLSEKDIRGNQPITVRASKPDWK